MGSLQQEKSGRWTARVSFNGRRVSRSTGTTNRQQAELFLQRLLAPLGLGERRVPLNDVWRQYLISPKRKELAPATLESKRHAWEHFSRWIERNCPLITQLSHISADLVGEYLTELQVDHCASTYNGRVCILREIFRTLQAKAGVVEDPWEGVRLLSDDSHARRELSVDEIRRLVHAANCVGNEWKMLFMVGIYTGLRLGDCCLLRWRDVDLARGIIQVVPRKTRRHARGMLVTIPLHPLLSKELSAHAREGEHVLPEIAALYSQSRGKVASRLERIFRAAGIRMSVMIAGRRRATPEATFHSLRHTFVSLAANAGVPLSVIASIVGHASTAMTRHYYHESETALRQAVDSLPVV